MPGFDIGGLDTVPFPSPDLDLLAAIDTAAGLSSDTGGASFTGGATGMLGAIVSWWSRQSVASRFSTGDLWLFEAPNVDVPYAVLSQVSEPVKDQTTAYQLVDGTYQVSCFASTAEQAYDLARSVRTAFHRATLDAAEDQPLHCYGGEVRMVPEAGLGGLGRDTWMAYAEIEILSQR